MTLIFLAQTRNKKMRRLPKSERNAWLRMQVNNQLTNFCRFFFSNLVRVVNFALNLQILRAVATKVWMEKIRLASQVANYVDFLLLGKSTTCTYFLFIGIHKQYHTI